MRRQIGAFEAKTRFSRIIEEVEQEGELAYQEAVAQLIEMRKLYQGEPGSFNLREAIEEGRP